MLVVSQQRPPRGIELTQPSRRRASDHEQGRSIYFFAVDSGAAEDGSPIPYNYSTALERINDLKFSVGEGGRYLELQDGNYLCCWVDDASANARLRFSLIRRNALPQSESRGALRDLMLGEEEGLCETSHIRMYPDGIVGVEFNFWAARPQRLPNYLMRLGGAPPAVLEALVRQDVAEQLERKRAIKKLIMRVRAAAVPAVEEQDESLGALLRNAAETSLAESVGIIFEPEPRGNAVLRNNVLNGVRRVLRMPGLRENVREFEVTAIDDESGRPDTLNLLQDKLIERKAILRQHERSRVLNADDAYTKIDEAYRELYQDLLSAMRASFPIDDQ